MPEGIILPGWVNLLLIAGVLAGAVTGISALSVRTGRGLTWVWRTNQQRTLAPAMEDIDRLEGKLDDVMRQLTSVNGGSMREQVNGIREDLSGHIAISARDREELRAWLEHIDPDGPPKEPS